jgi:Flp pilus assembly protein CpaB
VTSRRDSGALLRDLCRTIAMRRRLLAALCAGGAAAGALAVAAPAPPATTRVLAAARELAPGRALAAGDVQAVELPPAAVPDGALRPDAVVLGRVVTGPVRRGEPLTDVRLLGPELLAALPGGDHVAVPVRIADPAAVALLRTGDRVDVLAATEGAADAAPVAQRALVVAVPRGDSAGLDPLDGGALVVLAATPATARRLAQAAVASRLSVVVHG